VCTATNVVGLAVAGAGALAALVARAVKRPTGAF
jgi:hypothetical protein